MNLAGRMGRWSAEHWKTATVVWLLFVVLAVAVGRIAGVVKLQDSEQGTGETARAQRILQDAGFKTPASESVLVQSKRLTPPPVAPLSAPSFQTTSLLIAAPVVSIVVPPQPIAKGLDAGKSTCAFPSATPSDAR